MAPLKYQFEIEIFDGKGERLGSESLVPDVVPLVEQARLEAIRLKKIPAATGAPVSIAPVWDKKLGEPYVSALRASVGRQYHTDMPTTYFRSDARRASGKYVDSGKLRDGEIFYFKILAVPIQALADDAVEEISRPIQIAETPIAEFQGNSIAVGKSTDGEMPIFLRPEALREAREICAAAGDLEVGGILLGKIHRDSVDSKLLFLEITAQIAAEHTVKQQMRLTFTPDTWAAARAALRLRRLNEEMCGWWHFHPDWCRLRACDQKKRESCALAGIFFSTDDCAVTRTVFSQTFAAGLLISARHGVMQPTIFGWYQGVITQRSFNILRGDGAENFESLDSSSHQLTAAVGGNEDAEH